MICEWMRESREMLGIMDRNLERQLKTSQATKISNLDVERGLDLYTTLINGISLVFMKSHCLYGARCYHLDDELAKVLGFTDIQSLKRIIPIRKSRRFISVDSLRRGINRYAERSMDLIPMPECIKTRRRKQLREKI